MSVIAGLGLLERDHDLAALETLVAHGTSLALVEGPAGIGKTALLRAVAEGAQSAGRRVLRARGTELEREHAFGIARQLFEPALAGLDEQARHQALAGAAALAGPIAWPAAHAQDPQVPVSSPDRIFSILHGLYWLAANLAGDGPLLLVIDDLQWADEPSLRWVAYATHRLDDLAVPIVATVRTGERGPQEPILDALRSDPRTTVVEPRPLSVGAAARVLEAVFGRAVEPEFASACHAGAGGNPLVLRELGRALAADAVAPVAASVANVERAAPDSVSRGLLTRLGQLPEACRALASAAAVFEREAELVDAASLAHLDTAVATAAADELLAAGMMESAAPLRFAHPLLRAAVYSDLPEARRAQMHRDAAATLLASGAPDEDIAAHLMAGGRVGEPWAGRVLVEASRHALRRGSAHGAEPLLRRALAEPLEDRVRGEVLLELGTTGLATGAPDALAHLERALSLVHDPGLRALTLRRLTSALFSRSLLTECAELCDRILRAGDAEDEEVRMTAEAARVTLAFFRGSPEGYERLRHFEGLPGSTPAQRSLLLNLAGWRARDGIGTGPETAALAARALNAIRHEDMLEEHVLLTQAVMVLPSEGRFDRAEQVAARLEALAREWEGPMAFAFSSVARGGLNLLQGRLREAEADARAALEASREAGMNVLLGIMVAHFVVPTAERGAFDEAEKVLEEAGVSAEVPPLAAFNGALTARARLRLIQGRYEEALADSRLVGERVAAGLRTSFTNPWRHDAAMALLALGRPDEAAAVADEEHRLFSAWHPLWGLPSLRPLGLATGGEEGLEMMRRGAQELADSPLQLDAAYSLIDFGAALRRAKRPSEGRPYLERGMDVAHRIGATLLAERAREELAALGARPRRLATTGYDSLTASERRIAELAADGMSNPQIAQALYITRKTVEKHLGNAYWKLGINSREKLREALSAPTG